MKLAIFDFDGTLFPYDTLPFLLSQWKKQQYPIIPYLRTLSTVVVLYIQYKTGGHGFGTTAAKTSKEAITWKERFLVWLKGID